MCAKNLRSLPLAVIQEKPTFGTMEAHLWQFCQSDREKPTFEASKPFPAAKDLRSLPLYAFMQVYA